MKIPKLLLLIIGLTLLLVLSLFLADYYDKNQSPTIIQENGAIQNLLQYEWPQFQGDSSFTRFSSGPAPEAPDFLWKTNITGIQSYVVAFNGKVFVTTKTTVFALEKDTGEVLWSTTAPDPGPWPTVYKIDETHLVIGNSSLNIETGEIIWTSNIFSASGDPLFVANVYSPEEKMFYTKENSYIQAWDFADPTNPPILAWSTYVPGGGIVGSGVHYGDGIIFPGSFDPHQMALDAKTGKVLWDTETKSAMLFSGSYYEGKFFRGGTHDNTLYCFNATTGQILWTFNAETEEGYFSIGPATAYGMVYELNRDGHLYALNAENGEVVWTYKGPSPLVFPGSPVIADGKIYATTGQEMSYTAEQGNSEFACLDAFTGKLIWKLPIEAFAPRESIAVAYGNLYLIPGDVTRSVDTESGEEYDTINQVWAIGTKPWPMYRYDPVHSATGQSGPTTLSLLWNFTTQGAVVSSPSLADSRVYFGSQDKYVYCLNARTGKLFWKFQTNGRIKSSPAVVDGKVFIGPDDGYIYCLDAYTGQLIWSTYAGGPIQVTFAAAVVLRSSPIIVDDRVYVGSLDTNIYCLDSEKGDIIWSYQTDGYITSTPAIDDGALYALSQEPDSGALYKLDKNTGNLVWKKEIPYQEVFWGGTDLHASPAVAEEKIFTSSNIKEYYAISAITGEVEWVYRNDFAGEFILCSPIYNQGKVFLVDHFSVVCVDSETGDTIWSTYLGYELYVSPTYSEDKLYVVTDQRSVHVLNATNGEQLSIFKTGSNSWSSPTIYEGRVYVGNNDWNLYCFAENQATNSSIVLEMGSSKFILGEKILGLGQLNPNYPNQSIIISLLKPDGSTTSLQTTTSKNGSFTFNYEPDIIGDWIIAASWESEKSYYTSINNILFLISVESPSKVELSNEYVFVLIILIIILVSIISSIIFFRRQKRNNDSNIKDTNLIDS
ncbi:MAG: PQQ-binding-like beta-propeller repeat protein [Candidatus Bathyarchaeota archaeon]|nr:PQQ-binding-like beta-propeller repeat protein [Candidatus Bathyarchaeota archaeon]